MIPEFYSRRPEWADRIERIVESLGRIGVLEERSGQALELRRSNRIQLMAASRKVQGTRSPGQGCVIAGSGEIVTEGEYVDLVREKFPWARGALVMRVASMSTQL